MVDIQLKRAQIEEKYINAKNRLDFNRRRNNLVGDRLKQDQQEVALFLEKLREVRTLEREYFQLNPEQNEMESDEIYDTTGNEIQMNLSNDVNDAIEDESISICIVEWWVSKDGARRFFLECYCSQESSLSSKRYRK